jgi:hypothetical protein
MPVKAILIKLAEYQTLLTGLTVRLPLTRVCG